MSTPPSTTATDEELKTRLASLRNLADNKICLDCPTKNPTWASLTFAAFICMDCASHHRSMGVHLSFVRSSILDKWSETDVKRMEIGGNGRARSFFKTRGLEDLKFQKYSALAAKQYKAMLDRELGIASSEPCTPVTPPPSTVSSPPGSIPTSPTGLNGAGNSVTSPQGAEPTTPVSTASGNQSFNSAVAASTKNATAAAVATTIGKRPVSTKAKKGLGGAVKVGGNVQVTSGPVPEEAEAPAATVVTASSTSASASAKRTGPDYSGIGSQPQGSGSSPSNEMSSKVYARQGPDYGGLGSGGEKAAPDSGVDDLIWKSRNFFSQQKQTLGKKVESMGSIMKEILDDL